MEEILIISNYYPPEKGAAANRIEQLAWKLHQKNYKVSVICPLGNYPEGSVFPEYKGKFSVSEIRHNIFIKRLWIYPSISKNLLIRLLSVSSFSINLLFYLLFKKTPKKIIVQSPPILLSFICVFILSLKNKKIILNVSDLWPLAAIELKALKQNSFSHKFSLYLERFIYRKSSLLIGQSNEILDHVKSIVGKKKCFLYRNFPNHQIPTMELITKETQTIKIFYAGLLGIAQGVLEFCNKIDIDGLNIELHIFGDGVEKKLIKELIDSRKQKNIFFHGMMERTQLLQKLNSFDIAVVPLKVRIFGSVPSKIFEYGSLGFPILYFGGGEGETIVNENNLGWVVPVGNYSELNNKIKEISILSATQLTEMKNKVFLQSNKKFDLDSQIDFLIKKDVF